MDGATLSNICLQAREKYYTAPGAYLTILLE
jgi:hypothetical protein